MSFLELMKSIPAITRRKGVTYHRQGRVEGLVRAAGLVRAVVRGSEDYLVELRRSGKRWESSCTCPAWSKWGPCKHVCAVVLAAITGDEASGVERHAPGELELLESEARKTFARRHAPEPRPSAARLVELAQRAFAEPDARVDRALRGVLAPPRWPGQPAVLQLLAAKLKPGKPVRFEPLGPAALRGRFDPFDREVLELLGSGSHWLDAPGAQPLAPALQRLVLPGLAARGRLAFAEDEFDPPRMLELDAGGRWELGLALHRDVEELVLDAHLTRGAERLPASAVELALETDLAVAGERLLEVDWRGGRRFFAELGRALPQRFPEHDRAALLALVARCPRELPLDAPELVLEVGGVPTPVLVLPAPDEERTQLAARIELEYEGQRFARGEPARVSGGRVVRVRPDRERERAAEEEFAAAGGHLHATPRRGVAASLPSAGLRAAVEALTARGWRVEAADKVLRTAGTDALKVESGIDWFDLEAHFDFAGARAGLPAILEALERRTSFVRLDGGGYGLLPEEWLERWGVLLGAGKQVDGKLRFASGRAFVLDALLAGRGDVDVDAEFARLRARLAGAHEPRAEDAPAGFAGTLRAYQREGLGWLRFLGETGFGGCLADDMGLGKTVQVLAYLLARRASARATGKRRAQAGERRGPALVVAPRSLVFNWQSEAARFTPQLEVLVHHGPGRARAPAKLAAAELVLTTYGTLRQDAELLAKIEFELVVLDEAQAIKNHAAQAAKAARLLRADLRLALTGTPVENRLADLLSIFEFLNPGLLDGSRALRNLLRSGQDEHAVAHLAARALRPFLLRRTKEQVLAELPPKTEQVVLCELAGAQQKEYAALREHYRASVLGKVDALGLDRARMNVLEALLRLRQAACHLALLDPARADSPAAKLETLLPMLEEVREAGHKALVFSQFTSFLALLRKDLDARGLRYEYLDGRTRDREARVRAFQDDPACGLFVISLKAGGLGLNLTAADYVFLLDPWWNPAVERQAIDRTHRIGQTRAVTAYRLVAKDTVEEKVLALQDSKRALAEALFEGQGRALGELTRAELEWLLT